MKLNRTLTVAVLIAGSLFAAVIAGHAQNATNKPTAAAPPGARGRLNLDVIATQLALTDDQKTKAKPALEEMQQKLSALRQDTSITDPVERRTKTQGIRDAATAKLKEILTPEQLAKWLKLQTGTRPLPGAAAPPTGTTPPPK
jgi:Spy/CpxP family protein refolding chaperone